MWKVLALLLILFCSISTSKRGHHIEQKSLASSSDQCANLFAKKEVSMATDANNRLKENGFNVTRTLEDYKQDFGQHFSEKLLELGNESHWLDSGAGDAKAMFNYHVTARKWFASYKQRAYTTSLVYQKTPWYEKNEKRFPKKHKMLSGRYFEDIPLNELRKSDIITDLYGPFSYSQRLDLVIKKYLDILKDDGVLYLKYTSGDVRGTTVILPNGRKQPILGYLRNIRGLEVTQREKGFEQRNSNLVEVRIEKYPNYRSENVPSLELVEYIDMAPPKRVFRIVEN